ncbi:SRPBCC family protein [Raineyella sp. LH-20]|uniref:SRPBCC family protein n=1 Tax=Raineyella sp. LH-20 TaxID=3081204 RepID=UPI0029542D46|nr:SRPBCC family protein [Raineyella sp. LH-20]WOP18867.1 SRPBCC family protein [Raineyella sp. LH-20]
MAGHSITVSGTIAARPARVWRVITDLDHATTIIPSITAVERLTEGPYDVGTRWRETRTMMGRAETHEMEVAQAIPEVRTVVTTVAEGVTYATTMDLAPQGGGTLLTITFAADHPGATGVQRLLWAAAGPLGAAFTRRMLRHEVDEIRLAATNS